MQHVYLTEQAPTNQIHSPVYRYGHESQNTNGDGARRHKERELAVALVKPPILVQVEHEVERRVQERDENVRHGQVHQEVVRHRAHALVRQHDPDDDHVAASCHDEDDDEHDVKDELLPPWQREVGDLLQRSVGCVARLRRRVDPGFQDGAVVHGTKITGVQFTSVSDFCVGVPVTPFRLVIEWKT